MAFRLVHINIHAHNLIIDSAGVKIKAIHSRRAILIMKWNCWSLNALKCCMVVFQTAVFCLTLFVKEILPILDCSAVLVIEELSQLKKRRKSSFPPVFLKQKMPEKGGRREIVLAIESEVGSSLLFWSSHLEHKMYKKSDTELDRA